MKAKRFTLGVFDALLICPPGILKSVFDRKITSHLRPKKKKKIYKDIQDKDKLETSEKRENKELYLQALSRACAVLETGVAINVNS